MKEFSKGDRVLAFVSRETDEIYDTIVTEKDWDGDALDFIYQIHIPNDTPAWLSSESLERYSAEGLAMLAARFGMKLQNPSPEEPEPH